MPEDKFSSKRDSTHSLPNVDCQAGPLIRSAAGFHRVLWS